MESREEWCADKLSKLLNEELRISTLAEIKDHLQSISLAEVSRTVNILDLPLVFDCLNDSNLEQVDLACEVLSLCLANLNIGESTSRYSISLERALLHPNPEVNLMALVELERNVKNDDVLIDLCKKLSLLNNIIICVGAKDIRVAKKAAKVLELVGTSDLGIHQITSPELAKSFNEVRSLNKIAGLRVFEIFVNISVESKSSFEILNLANMLYPMIEELDDNDILVRLNVIEILTHLGLTEHGFVYLENHNIMSKLYQLIDDKNNLVDVQLVEPGIIKYFGNIAHWKPKEYLSKYSGMVEKIYKNLEDLDFSLVGVSLDTLGYIGITNQGKLSLDSAGEGIITALKLISVRLISFPTELKVRALKCLENLLRVTEGDGEILAITKRWFCLVGSDNSVEIFNKYAKNPFAEIRFAGLGVINAISTQEWGQEVIKNTPGMVEFLLDRNIETHKDCKVAKYEIVKLLSTATVFEAPEKARLKEYVSEGPFYVQGTMEVAFEGN